MELNIKVYYQNCKKRKANAETVIKFADINNIDILILAEASSFDFSNFNNYRFKYISKSKSGLNILSKIELELNYIQFDETMERNKDRLVLVKFEEYQLIAVHIPADTKYHYLEMKKLVNLDLSKVEVIVGDFNTGYSFDSDKDAVQFKSGEIHFPVLEKMGFINYGKNKGYRTYRNNRNGKLVRIDQVFHKSKSVKPEYIEFLDDSFDHKGILLNISKKT